MSFLSGLSGLSGRKYASIGPADAQRRTDDGAVLLDVREPSEWRAGHAPKARHIPLADLDRRHKELPAGREIITVCRSGSRSGPRRSDSRCRRAHRAQPDRWDAGVVGRRPSGRRQGWTARAGHLMRTLMSALPGLALRLAPRSPREAQSRCAAGCATRSRPC